MDRVHPGHMIPVCGLREWWPSVAVPVYQSVSTLPAFSLIISPNWTKSVHLGTEVADKRMDGVKCVWCKFLYVITLLMVRLLFWIRHDWIFTFLIILRFRRTISYVPCDWWLLGSADCVCTTDFLVTDCDGIHDCEMAMRICNTSLPHSLWDSLTTSETPSLSSKLIHYPYYWKVLFQLLDFSALVKFRFKIVIGWFSSLAYGLLVRFCWAELR